MTEKRFKHSEWYQDDGQLIYWGIDDTEKSYVYNMVDKVTVQISEEQLIDLLNNLHEENQELKQSDTITDLETQIMHFKEENEQLKQQVVNIVENGLKELFGDKYRIIEDIGD